MTLLIGMVIELMVLLGLLVVFMFAATAQELDLQQQQQSWAEAAAADGGEFSAPSGQHAHPTPWPEIIGQGFLPRSFEDFEDMKRELIEHATDNESIAELLKSMHPNWTEMLLPGQVAGGPMGDPRDAPYFGYYFGRFRLYYTTLHGYLSLSVCLFGLIANFLNIIVLTRRDMVSPVNMLLTGMAGADILVIGSYIPYTLHNFIFDYQSEAELFTREWTYFTLFHAHFTVVCHTISIWLTVILAVWRYLAVSFPTNSKAWCCMERAKWAILITWLVVPVFCIPVYLSFTVKEDQIWTDSQGNATIYKIDFSDVAKEHDGFLQRINFWVFSVFTKLVPCILLTFLSVALIRALIEANRRKERLKGANTRGMRPSSRANPVVTQPQSAAAAAATTQQAHVVIISQASPAHHNGGHNTERDQLTMPEDGATKKIEDELQRRRQDNHAMNNDNQSSHSQQQQQAAAHTAGCGNSMKIFTVNSSPAKQSFTPNDGSDPGVVTSGGVAPTPTPPPPLVKAVAPPSGPKDTGQQQNDRTTKMLIAVLLMFLACEFPSGILAVLSGVIGDDFFKNVYTPLGEVMDLAALINSAVNFVLYCLMSRQFRKTFTRLFCHNWLMEGLYAHITFNHPAAAAAAGGTVPPNSAYAVQQLRARGRGRWDRWGRWGRRSRATDQDTPLEPMSEYPIGNYSEDPRRPSATSAAFTNHVTGVTDLAHRTSF